MQPIAFLTDQIQPHRQPVSPLARRASAPPGTALASAGGPLTNSCSATATQPADQTSYRLIQRTGRVI